MRALVFLFLLPGVMTSLLACAQAPPVENDNKAVAAGYNQRQTVRGPGVANPPRTSS